MNKIEVIIEKTFAFMIYLTIAFLVGMGCYALFKTTVASGKIESCYVEHETSGRLYGYVVYGRREWRKDYVVSVTTDTQKAEFDMRHLCPVNASVEASVPSP